jgi:Type IV conjugative transfer system lipoprotein (TraV)
MNAMMKKVISVLIGTALLSGCNPNHKNLDCPLGKGMHCSSISKVNQAVNEGRLTEDSLNGKVNTPIPPQLAYHGETGGKSLQKLPKTVTRIPEKTLRIWLTGFTDDNGDYVEETYAHIVSEPGIWREGE